MSYKNIWQNVSPDFSHVLLVTGSRSWNDEPMMRQVFSDLWERWDPTIVTRPLLLSGHAVRGSDAMAEGLWHHLELEVRTMPANWDHDGRNAGAIRNQKLVDTAVALRASGAQVHCCTFLDRCPDRICPSRDNRQIDGCPEHLSHAPIDCRRRAADAGIDVTDVLAADLCPF